MAGGELGLLLGVVVTDGSTVESVPSRAGSETLAAAAAAAAGAGSGRDGSSVAHGGSGRVGAGRHGVKPGVRL